MKTPLNAGLAIGVFVTLWTFLMGFTGWYKDPGKMWGFWVVVPMQIIILIWMLKKTAAQGRPYGGQIVAGLVASLVAGLIVFLGSWVFMTVVFPNYFSDLRAMAEQMMAAQGQTPEQIKTALDAQAPLQTPLMQACFGLIGTVLTGFLTSLVAGVFIRHKGPAAAQPAPARA
ncbi:MAG: DUF4199 domain-containing protein [Candidatus Eiseniibacteriota bacterium]